MWKSSKKEEERTPAPAPAPPPVVAAPVYNPPPPPPAPPLAAAPVAPIVQHKAEVSPKMADIAHIGKSVIIRGELSGSEDLYLDGEVEGSIELKGHSLTIGPNGHIRANVHALEVVIHGRVDGNIRAADRVELKKSAVLAGDIFTQRIMIEDGAFFKGAIDIQKPEAKHEAKVEPKHEAKPEPKKEAAPVAASSAAATSSTGFSSTSTFAQAPLIETK
jgi:cytoskeletal protein CcmA (bactofilin family)